MNKDNIEIAPFDNLLVYKKGYTAEVVSRIIKERNLGGLRIFAVLKEDRLESLDFLRGYSFLEKLDVTSALDYDFGFLKELTRLKKLSISTEGNKVINIGDLVNLEYLTVKWRKEIIGFENCLKLSSLTLVEFNEKDLSKIQNLKSLNHLRIKTGAIGSMHGAINLVNLQYIYIGNCKKLKSVKDVNHLPNLKELCFDACPNINDFVELNDLPNLDVLGLTDCGKVKSLSFLRYFKSLSKLSLLGNTVIVDGDLLPAKHLKSVEHKHYSHYNIKLENQSYNQNIANNIGKIKGGFK